jgi:AraC-like DNA-binding protein
MGIEPPRAPAPVLRIAKKGADGPKQPDIVVRGDRLSSWPQMPATGGTEVADRLVVKTLESTPRDATHWSVRSMAAATGMSRPTVHRIWKAFGLQPHRTETFKLSTDPQLIERVRDIVGLYLNPPERALVLCADEKSQIQALDRTQPILHMRPGQAERRTLWSWSKVVRRIALRAAVPRFSTHTLRHLCLTDLARAGWELHTIATFAGHHNPATTLQYIHLSGRDLAAKLANGMAQIHAWRIAQLATPFLLYRPRHLHTV